MDEFRVGRVFAEGLLRFHYSIKSESRKLFKSIKLVDVAGLEPATPYGEKTGPGHCSEQRDRTADGLDSPRHRRSDRSPRVENHCYCAWLG
jgi:hypothetical protein